MNPLATQLNAALSGVHPEMSTPAQQQLLAYVAMSAPHPSIEEAQLLVTALAHPTLDAHIQANTLPGPLAQGLGGLLHTLMAQLGLRPVGHLAKLSNEALRAFGAKRRTFETIARHAHGAKPARQRDVLAAYLSTKPGPLFARAMSVEFEQVWPLVLEDARSARHLEVFRAHAPLADLLRTPQVDAGALSARMVAAAQAIEDQGHRERVALALRSEDLDARLVASACAAFWRRIEHASQLLEGVIAAAPDALVLAVLAARMDPAMARQVFSLFLVDLSLGNPEEPEYQMTPARTRALVATRWLLPHVGSPIEDEQIEVMRQSPHEVVQQALLHVESLWEAWGSLERELL